MSKNLLNDHVEAVAPLAEAEPTDEELQQLRDKASQFMKKDRETTAASATLLLARRLYSTAMYSLQTRAKAAKVDERVVSYIVGAIGQQAMAPFERASLLEEIAEGTIPWLTAEIADANAREQKAAKSQAQQTDEQRRKTPLPLPFQLHADSPMPPVLPRLAPQAVAGSAMQVTAVLSRIADLAEKANKTTLRLVPGTRPTSGFTRKNVLTHEVGINTWLQAGSSFGRFIELVDRVRPSFQGGKLDLIVIDNPRGLYEDYNAFDIEQQAAHGLKILKKVCERFGCAAVLGVPVTDKPVFNVWEAYEDVADSYSWRQLSTYARCVQLKTLGTVAEHDDGPAYVLLSRLLGQDEQNWVTLIAAEEQADFAGFVAEGKTAAEETPD